MEQKINIAEILKDCPKGTKLYSPIFGDCKFVEVDNTALKSILVEAVGVYAHFTNEGYYIFHGNGERIKSDICMLFPSKDCRTWENFKAPWKHKHFEAFEKVLVRLGDRDKWHASFYSHYDQGKKRHVATNNLMYKDKDIISYMGNEDKVGKEEM